jgi:PTH2 family peptidyl-tRNA hydrolase
MAETMPPPTDKQEFDGEDVLILTNGNVRMSPGKLAAQAVHAALLLYGIPHGSVVVLNGRPNQIRQMPAQIKDAGLTEIARGTLTAGAVFR